MDDNPYQAPSSRVEDIRGDSQQLASRGLHPIIGIVGSLVNVLLIFREDHRCGHDLAAGTRVVMV